MMSEPFILDCDVYALSLERASGLVPPEFLPAYQRFIDYEGRQIPRLPRGEEEMARGLDVKLASQRGIHSPNYDSLPSLGAGKRKYALSIHSEGQAYYDDKDVVTRPDGTWILDYKAHRPADGKKPTDQSTSHLMNNLDDGVPVGVMIRNKSGYAVLGLAFVEQYNTETDSFTIHGPVNAQTEADRKFYLIRDSDLTQEERQELDRLKAQITAERDDRIRRFVTSVVRQRQDSFRKALLEAYNGTCPVTHADVNEALQAAHIDRYRGSNSQVVSNGILLRADIHSLYDANLLSIEPETHILRLSHRLDSSAYRAFANEQLKMPTGKAAPDDELLEMQYKRFLAAQKSMAS